MELPAIGLDNHARCGPTEVDLLRAVVPVHLRSREAVAKAELDELGFEQRARGRQAVRLGVEEQRLDRRHSRSTATSVDDRPQPVPIEQLELCSTSGRSRVRIRCSPGKSRRPAALATTSVVSPRSSRSSCHSAAPLKAPSIDPGPRASVAACHRTMSPDWRWPSAYTPRRTAMSRPARTQREIRPGVSPAVSNCLRDTSPCCASASSTSAGSMSLFGRTRTRTRHREAPVGHRGRIATGAPPFRYERCDFESYPE